MSLKPGVSASFSLTLKLSGQPVRLSSGAVVTARFNSTAGAPGIQGLKGDKGDKGMDGITELFIDGGTFYSSSNEYVAQINGGGF